MLRTLRIVVTVLGLAACVLLVVLWKRSIWLHEAVYAAISPTHAVVASSGFSKVHLYAIPTSRLSGLPQYGNVQTCLFCCSSRLRTAVLYNDAPRGLQIAMPHWFALIVAATTATAPWLSWRFSLRTMLIGMTLLAVLLGIMKASI
jgi:hypothetical protein